MAPNMRPTKVVSELVTKAFNFVMIEDTPTVNSLHLFKDLKFRLQKNWKVWREDGEASWANRKVLEENNSACV